MDEGRELRVLLPPSVGHVKAGARAEVLEVELRRRLGQPVAVRVAETYDELADLARRQRVDLVWAPPQLFAEEAEQAWAAMRAVRGPGDTTQRAAVLVRADSPHHELWRLRGVRAAWVDASSMSGYQMPVELLAKRGVNLDEMFTSQKFYGSFRDALMAVIKGDADLCSIFVHGMDADAVKESLNEIVGGLSDRLRAIGFTDPVPADGLLITRRVDEDAARDLAALITSPRCPSLLPETCSARSFVLYEPQK